MEKILKTVFITGAGFSVPYGYPTGKKLVNDIITRYKDNPTYSKLSQSLINTNFESIDQYINEKNSNNEQYLADLAIEAITHELLLAEDVSLSNEIDAQEDVVKLILNNIDEPLFEQFTIITFNYDRYFEYRLFNKLNEKYKDESKVFQTMNHLKIIYMHGQMIPFSTNSSNLANQPVVPYGLDNHCRQNKFGFEIQNKYKEVAATYAKSNFKTVDSNTDEFSLQAQSAIQAAQRIYFLGFGFDEKNMNKLGINPSNSKLKKPYDWKNKIVAATVKGLSRTKINEISSKYDFFNSENLVSVHARGFFEDYHHILHHKFNHKNKDIAPCCYMNANQTFEPPKGSINFQVELDGLTHEFLCATCNKQCTAQFKYAATNNWILDRVL